MWLSVFNALARERKHFVAINNPNETERIGSRNGAERGGERNRRRLVVITLDGWLLAGRL